LTSSNVIVADYAGVNAVEKGPEVGTTSGYYTQGLDYVNKKGKCLGEEGVFCAGIDSNQLGYRSCNDTICVSNVGC
jgi:hypothetical protein